MARLTINLSDKKSAALEEAVKNLKELGLDTKPRDLVEAVIDGMDDGAFESSFLETHMAKLKDALAKRKKRK